MSTDEETVDATRRGARRYLVAGIAACAEVAASPKAGPTATGQYARAARDLAEALALLDHQTTTTRSVTP